MKQETKVLFLIFLTIFIDMLGVGILIPIFPLLVIPTSSFKIIPPSWDISSAFIMAGWLIGSFPLMQFLFSPILGQLADKYGRRKILALSIGGTAFSYLLFTLAIWLKSIPLMFISRILDGISGGNISIASAIIGDISRSQKRAKNFGLIGVAIGLGFILGPFIGGRLSDNSLVFWFNPTTPFLFAAILSFINFFLVIKFLPETLVNTNAKAISITRSFVNIANALSTRLRYIIPPLFLFNAGFTFFTTFWGIILNQKFGFNQVGISNFFGFLGIMIILAQGLVVRRLSGKVEDYKVLRYSIIGAGIVLWLYYCIPANKSEIIYYTIPFLAVTIALTKAFSNALITRVTPTNEVGEAMGINSSATALAQAIPAILAGYIASNSNSTLPIFTGSIITILGGILFIYKFRPN